MPMPFNHYAVAGMADHRFQGRVVWRPRSGAAYHPAPARLGRLRSRPPPPPSPPPHLEDMGDTAPPTRPTRRGFLGGAVAATSAVLLVACEDPRPSDQGFKPQSVLATPLPEVDAPTALNTVLAIEHNAIFAYTAAAPLLTDPGVASLATGFRRDHEVHRDALAARIRSIGGTPVQAKPTYDLGNPAPKTQADALKLAAGLEAVAAAAYFTMVSSVSDPDLLRFLASIMGDEAQHAAVLEAAIGKPPVPAPFQTLRPESVTS